jgi:curved DNA-binding protein CbpA
MLGLPLGRRLAAAEIHQAYKRAAKTAHPDSGGNGQEFRELSAARDALMKER